MLKARLAAFGYEVKDSDEKLLSFALRKAEFAVRNECNVKKVPKELKNVVEDIAAGEFLLAKKAFGELDLDVAVERVQQGDTETVFAVGQTPEQRLDSLIQHLLNSGREQFSCYRRVKW